MLLCVPCGCSFFKEEMTVLKAITPWSAFSRDFGVSLQHVVDVYDTTKAFPHLVHCKQPPSLMGDLYEVELEPVGVTPSAAEPQSEQQLAYAVQGLLTALDSLHKVGTNFCVSQVKSIQSFQHRTIICTPAGVTDRYSLAWHIVCFPHAHSALW